MKWFMSESAKMIAKNPSLATGQAALMQGATNNVKGFRAYTDLGMIKLQDGSQAPYLTKAGKPLSTSEFDFDSIPKDFYQKVLRVAREKKMFFYDLVSLNIIKTKDGELSLIDLESVYQIDELYTINRHNAKVKPDYYHKELKKLWRKNI